MYIPGCNSKLSHADVGLSRDVGQHIYIYTYTDKRIIRKGPVQIDKWSSQSVI